MKLIFAFAFTVLGLTFFLGYLLGSFYEVEFSWRSRGNEEPKQRAGRSSGFQLASIETGTSLQPIIQEEVVTNTSAKPLSGDMVPSHLEERKRNGRGGAIDMSRLKELEHKTAHSKGENQGSNLRVVSPLEAAYDGRLVPKKRSVLSSSILRRGEGKSSKIKEAISQASDVFSSKPSDRYNSAVLMPPSLDVVLSTPLPHHSLLNKNPRYASPKHDVRSKGGRSQRFSSEGRYYILVGSFANRQVALRQRENLRQNAYPAYLRQVDFGRKGVRHHVLVGRYQDVERVTEEAGRLRRMENVKPRIFKEGDESIR